MQMSEILSSATADYKTQLTEEKHSKFEVYYKLLKEWNEKINLTAITDAEGVAVKHFADSLSVLNYCNIPQNAKVLDVGTGAGFPGVVLKIVRPDIQLFLLDSLKKRFLFLDALLSELDLDAEFLRGRAEEYGQDIDLRESFDLSFHAP